MAPANGLYGRRSGLIAAAVLATSALYYALSRVIILDMPVSVLLTAALLSFLVGMHETPGLKRRLYLWGFYAVAALAVLTKGLIGILIPGMSLGAWIAMLGEWRVLRTIYLPSGIVLFLLIAAPWHILAGRANPEFFNFYFIHEHFQRYLTKIHNHYKPAWYFIPVLLAGFSVDPVPGAGPTFSAPSSWRERHEHRDALFLMLWAGLVFLFFRFELKTDPYILPVFPPLAILIGRYLSTHGTAENCRLRPGYIGLVVLSIVIAAGLAITPRYRTGMIDQGLHHYFYLSALVLTGVLSAWMLHRRKNFKWAFLRSC
jgi:4-amino-4-deoxy-L-arabinose transferase-like glycosyltransferase